ncbi:hypothetical protein [Corynebacterium sp. 335C]
MFAPYPDGVYTLFPSGRLDAAIASMDIRPASAGYLPNGEVLWTDEQPSRYSWLA